MNGLQFRNKRIKGEEGNLKLQCKRRVKLTSPFLSSYMASNNFVALLGMFIMYKTQIYLPLDIYTKYTRHVCAFRVVWRFFGFNSGCIAVVMATERWLALTRPFFYRKIVTQSMTVKTLIGFCIFAALLSVCPLAGFGAYFSEATNACVRYRDGRDPIDVAYAFTFFSFGNTIVVVAVVVGHGRLANSIPVFGHANLQAPCS